MNHETLRFIREEKGYSRSKLAREIGVSPQFIQQLEAGEKQPSISTAAKLAAALGVTIDELVKEPT